MKKTLLIVGVLSLLLTLSYSATQALRTNSAAVLLAQTETDDEETDEACTDCGDEEESCEKDTYSCKPWSTCSADFVQKRTCTLIDDCGAKTPKPAESQTCKPEIIKTPEPVKTTDPEEKTEEQKKIEAEKQAALQKAIDLKKAAELKKVEELKKIDQAAKLEEAQKAAEVKAAEAKKEEDLRKAEEVKKALTEEETLKAEALKKAAEEEALLKATQEQKQLEEAQKKAEEEIRLIQEEELRKKAEEEARTRAEEELAARQKQEAEKQKMLEEAIAATPVFEEIFTSPPTPVTPLFEDRNSNGVPDQLETFPSRIDEELVRFQADLRVQESRLITDQGKSEKEAQVSIYKAYKKKKAQKKVTAIRENSKKRYGVVIKNSKQGTEKSGTSDEVAILLGINPHEKVSAKTNLLPLEKKLLRIKDAATVEKKCSMSIANGDVLAAKGFTILAACPKNKTFNLVAVNPQGKETTIETKTTSDNGKLVYAINQKFSTGNFVFQLKEKPSHPLGFLPSSWFTSALDSTDSELVQSDPVFVDVVENASIPEPEVQSIEGIDVAGLKDIKISATADGKVRVTGLADISTMVIGTFSSAIFTSAILADVESGSFEVISPRPLETGDHEVVIYATKPEESTQSPPAKLRFSIIQTAQAAPLDSHPRPVAIQLKGEGKTQNFPLIPVLAFGGLAALFIGIGLYLKKNKKANV